MPKISHLLGAVVLLTQSTIALAEEPFVAGISKEGLDLSRAEDQRKLISRARKRGLQECAPKPYPASYEPVTLAACLQRFRAASERTIAAHIGSNQLADARGRNP